MWITFLTKDRRNVSTRSRGNYAYYASFRSVPLTEHIIITENFRVIETRHGISERNANVSFRDEAHFYRHNIATAGIGGARHLG